jgi:hypothetical protein
MLLIFSGYQNTYKIVNFKKEWNWEVWDTMQKWYSLAAVLWNWPESKYANPVRERDWGVGGGGSFLETKYKDYEASILTLILTAS